ncbi:MAG TPA: glycine zipper 2TM domain-containing protein [Burkholderiales bacterium]|nr:glycine zipper 2TM domain-containing protein [Burkholderiales bacterium]
MGPTQALDNIAKRGGLLYPLLVIAAIAVTVFCAIGLATMLGWMPSAMSGSAPAATAGGGAPHSGGAPAANVPATKALPGDSRTPGRPTVAANCRNCGVIESIRAIEVKGQSSWLGAAGGAVVGGLLGHQIGHGGGRTAATVVGAGAGAYAGNEIEKQARQSVQYRVRVRMDDGTLRTYYEKSPPGYAVGQKVRVTDQGLTAAG